MLSTATVSGAVQSASFVFPFTNEVVAHVLQKAQQCGLLTFLLPLETSSPEVKWSTSRTPQVSSKSLALLRAKLNQLSAYRRLVIIQGDPAPFFSQKEQSR